jgi:hypothetical protein
MNWTWHELLQTLSIQESSPNSYSVLVECSSKSPWNCASEQKSQLQKLHEVAAFIDFELHNCSVKQKGYFQGSGDVFLVNTDSIYLFHSLRCWVFCTKCPPSSSYLAQSMHIMKNDHVKSLCNRWTSWGSTLCNACAIYGYREEESPCAILVQICEHREEAPCEVVVQSKDIMKKNHLVQSVNIMTNPSPVCQSLYLWCRDWCLLQRGVAWIMVMMWFLVSSRVNSQIVPTYSWIVWWEKLSSTLELSLWTLQRNKTCAEMMTLGGGGCKE